MIDLETGITLKDRIIESLESQLKTSQHDRTRAHSREVPREDKKYAELLEQKKRTDEINHDVIS